MKGVRFTALAKSDLQEIHDFISRDNPKLGAIVKSGVQRIKRHSVFDLLV